MFKNNYGGDDMINWNEAPEWADTALTTSHNWQGNSFIDISGYSQLIVSELEGDIR